MRTWFIVGLLSVAVAVFAFQSTPRFTTVDPDTGKKGDTITAKGENVGKSGIGELYLTDGQKDTKVDISTQSDTEVKFTIPEIKAGRYHLLVLTANKASLIEQPVVVTVE
ncbi:MAG TPA: IPT/TIG domain-containing protein [Bryobacteraceae bacterium]|nr:IPT/TIG domain-containing protein [Bryobacteraceae bacterium]